MTAAGVLQSQFITNLGNGRPIVEPQDPGSSYRLDMATGRQDM
jgi:hypothetical protein